MNFGPAVFTLETQNRLGRTWANIIEVRLDLVMRFVVRLV